MSETPDYLPEGYTDEMADRDARRVLFRANATMLTAYGYATACLNQMPKAELEQLVSELGPILHRLTLHPDSYLLTYWASIAAVVKDVADRRGISTRYTEPQIGGYL